MPCVVGIKAVKLYAWEEPYKARILSLRHIELTHIRHMAHLEVGQALVMGSTPILIALSAFAVFTAQGYSLTPAVAFPALALFNLLRFPITLLPWFLMDFMSGVVALNRVQDFLEVCKTQHCYLSCNHHTRNATVLQVLHWASYSLLCYYTESSSMLCSI